MKNNRSFSTDADGAILRFKYYTLLFFLFMSPFAFSSFVNRVSPVLPTATLLLLATTYVFGLFLLRTKKLFLVPSERVVLIGLFLPFLFSIPLVGANFLFHADSAYALYVSMKLPGRLANAVFFFSLFVLAMSFIGEYRSRPPESFARWYFAGTAVLVFFGIWQWLHNYLNVPMFDLDTRSYMFGLRQNGFSYLVDRIRLTSLLDEPNFLVAFLIDGLLLGPLLVTSRRYYAFGVVAPFLFVLLFSFSAGGYLNLLLLCGVVLLTPGFLPAKIKKKAVAITIAALFLAGTIFYQQIFEFLFPILGRLDSLFNQTSTRIYMMVSTLRAAWDDPLPFMIFGHGPGSVFYLNFKGLPMATSNSMYLDLFYETGLFGLLAALWMFSRLLKENISFGWTRDPRVRWIYLLICHLAITSTYRADFFSSRFWSILILVLAFHHSFREGTSSSIATSEERRSPKPL
ncbi:MAG TPA: hypothetical protein PKH10_03280 [bacterium]|nr:hypothetical protein [bacterium]